MINNTANPILSLKIITPLVSRYFYILRGVSWHYEQTDKQFMEQLHFTKTDYFLHDSQRLIKRGETMSEKKHYQFLHFFKINAFYNQIFQSTFRFKFFNNQLMFNLAYLKKTFQRGIIFYLGQHRNGARGSPKFLPPPLEAKIQHGIQQILLLPFYILTLFSI